MPSLAMALSFLVILYSVHAAGEGGLAVGRFLGNLPGAPAAQTTAR
jgi:hypothetical protein